MRWDFRVFATHVGGGEGGNLDGCDMIQIGATDLRMVSTSPILRGQYDLCGFTALSDV